MIRRTTGAVLVALALVTPAALAAADTTAPPQTGSVDLGGTPVQGGSAPDPTTLTAGLWSDAITGPGASEANTRWFRYERTMADSTVLVGAVATSPEEFGDGIQVALTTRAGIACGDDSDTTGAARGAMFGAVVAAGLDEEGGSTDCSSTDDLVIAVKRTADSDSTLPYALRIVEEAPVRRDRGAEPAEETLAQVPEPQEPTSRPGGDSFESAPEITDGTVSAEVLQGTERLWKVHLDWGQALAVRLDVAVRPDSDIISDPIVRLTLADPMRDTFEDNAVDAETNGAYGSDGAQLFDATPPVAYLNRFRDGIAFVPGDYWVSVAVAAGAERPLDVPVELTVAVTGAKTEPPGFTRTLTGPGGDPGPADYAPTTPYLVSDGVFSADVSGTPTSPDVDTADSDVRRLAGFGVGAASLLSLLAGLVLLRRRTRVSRAAAR